MISQKRPAATPTDEPIRIILNNIISDYQKLVEQVIVSFQQTPKQPQDGDSEKQVFDDLILKEKELQSALDSLLEHQAFQRYLNRMDALVKNQDTVLIDIVSKLKKVENILEQIVDDEKDKKKEASNKATTITTTTTVTTSTSTTDAATSTTSADSTSSNKVSAEVDQEVSAADPPLEVEDVVNYSGLISYSIAPPQNWVPGLNLHPFKYPYPDIEDRRRSLLYDPDFVAESDTAEGETQEAPVADSSSESEDESSGSEQSDEDEPVDFDF